MPDTCVRIVVADFHRERQVFKRRNVTACRESGNLHKHAVKARVL